MSPKYFYAFKNINDDEPAQPVEIPKGLDISPSTKVIHDTSIDHIQHIEAFPEVQTLVVKPIEYNGYDLNIVLQTILKSLNEISQKKYYGETLLVDVLRGSKNKRILTDGLDSCETYGSLSNIKREEVQFLVEWLIQNGYILQTKGTYPVLHPTYNGQHYGEIMTSRKISMLRSKMKNIENF